MATSHTARQLRRVLVLGAGVLAGCGGIGGGSTGGTASNPAVTVPIHPTATSTVVPPTTIPFNVIDQLAHQETLQQQAAASAQQREASASPITTSTAVPPVVAAPTVTIPLVVPVPTTSPVQRAAALQAALLYYQQDEINVSSDEVALQEAEAAYSEAKQYGASPLSIARAFVDLQQAQENVSVGELAAQQEAQTIKSLGGTVPTP